VKAYLILNYKRNIRMDPLPLIAEFFGTFVLLLAIFATGNAFIIGATLAFNCYFLGSISGSHVNPAVSLAMLIKGAITGTEFVTYSVAQLAGAVSAYYTYNSLA
jgi:aquaporin Z